MVNPLVYNTNTPFDECYTKDEKLRSYLKGEKGDKIISNLKKGLARFAFKEIAYKMAQELGLDISVLFLLIHLK